MRTRAWLPFALAILFSVGTTAVAQEPRSVNVCGAVNAFTAATASTNGSIMLGLSPSVRVALAQRYGTEAIAIRVDARGRPVTLSAGHDPTAGSLDLVLVLIGGAVLVLALGALTSEATARAQTPAI